MSVNSFRKSYKSIASIIALIESMGIMTIDLAFLRWIPQLVTRNGIVYSGAAVWRHIAST